MLIIVLPLVGDSAGIVRALSAGLRESSLASASAYASGRAPRRRGRAGLRDNQLG